MCQYKQATNWCFTWQMIKTEHLNVAFLILTHFTDFISVILHQYLNAKIFSKLGLQDIHIALVFVLLIFIPCFFGRLLPFRITPFPFELTKDYFPGSLIFGFVYLDLIHSWLFGLLEANYNLKQQHKMLSFDLNLCPLSFKFTLLFMMCLG